ncbi:MAG TPA: ABC transporter substrate-binding protein, partial [Candidatus Acidoferrales bacterium]|nr:ABC transporter substrate-binding protein [Candidatus Acidoferrales bacterium]
TVEAIEILSMDGDAYPPLPAHLLAKLPDLNQAAFNSAPISSGPFILQRWDRGNSLTFVANPLYFRGPPGLKEIVWKIIPNPSTLLNELRAHQIDLYPSVNEDEIDQLGSISGIVVQKRLVAWWQHLGMNMSRPPLNDPNVRAAIAEGVDWKRILDTVYRGDGQLAVSDIFPGSWAAPSLPPYRYDPTDARRLLAKAHWRAGTTLTLTSAADNEVNNRAELLIQSMLQQIGIGIEIKNYPANLLFAQDGPIYTGKYDLEWSQEINGSDPDDSGSWNSRFIPPHGADTSWLNDPIVDRTSEAAASTFDQAKRKALYQEEAARIRQLNPAVFVFWHEAYYAYNSDLRNFKPAAFIGNTWNAWQWQI